MVYYPSLPWISRAAPPSSTINNPSIRPLHSPSVLNIGITTLSCAFLVAHRRFDQPHCILSVDSGLRNQGREFFLFLTGNLNLPCSGSQRNQQPATTYPEPHSTVGI